MFHAVVFLPPTNNPNLDLTAPSARFIVSIFDPTIVMALVSVGANYVIYVADCTTSCGAWLQLVSSKQIGRPRIAMSALMLLNSSIVFRLSFRFPIKHQDFWAVMPACLMLATSMASALFILVLACRIVLAEILIRAGGKCRVACGILGVSTESVVPPGPSMAAAA